MRAFPLFFIMLFYFPSSIAQDNNQQFITLSYHDVGGDASMAGVRNIMSLKDSELVSQFSWLREHGYHPVSLDAIIAAKKGGKALPDKAILLTFDDGYRSVYTRVYPLLKLFNYPAVIALVGQWMDVPPGEMVAYGDDLLPRERFLRWDEVTEMVDSGLVEVASHSYDLHRGITANPQKNSQPAATTRRYDEVDATYESEESYRARLLQDLQRSVTQIKHHIGKAPRAMIWPYGAYSEVTIEIAAQLGMPYTMGLESGNTHLDGLANIKRILMQNGATLADLLWTLKTQKDDPVRVAHVDLDYIYDLDPARQEKNLGLLLDRIKSLKINTVYLQAYADPDGDGHADALYFPNRHLPVRADLFNRVAWQLRTRSGVNVYAWLPVLAYQFEDDHHPLANFYVQAVAAKSGVPSTESYRRLSPFHPQVRQWVGDIYEDLARHANFSGILFHDDAYLSDFGDSSSWALQHYQTVWGLPPSVEEIRQNPALMQQWTKHKTGALIEFTHYLRDRVRSHRPTIKTARNIYARVIMQPESESWFAQSFNDFIDNYDYTAVMAMPFMEGASDPDAWLETLVARADMMTSRFDKVVFELQSVDWRDQTQIGSAELARHMRLLQKNGAENFGYYPDDFISGYPQLDVIHPEFSLSTYPYLE